METAKGGKEQTSDLIELPLRLVLDGPDVLHGEAVPLVDPAEDLPVEVEEEAALRLLDERLHLVLQAPPLELARHQLVAGHDGLHLRGVAGKTAIVTQFAQKLECLHELTRL